MWLIDKISAAITSNDLSRDKNISDAVTARLFQPYGRMSLAMQSTDRQHSGMADRRIPETFMWIAMQGDFPWAFASVACLLYFLSMILKSKIIVIFAENGITSWTFQGGFGRLRIIPCG
jgi:hypothetical protein